MALSMGLAAIIFLNLPVAGQAQPQTPDARPAGVEDPVPEGPWHSSPRILVNSTMSVASYLWHVRQPESRQARFTVRVDASLSKRFVTEEVELSIDGVRSTHSCSLEGKGSYRINPGALLPLSIRQGRAVCDLPFAVSEALMQARAVEIRLGVAGRDLKSKNLKPKQVAKLQRLTKLVGA